MFVPTGRDGSHLSHPRTVPGANANALDLDLHAAWRASPPSNTTQPLSTRKSPPETPCLEGLARNLICRIETCFTSWYCLPSHPISAEAHPRMSRPLHSKSTWTQSRLGSSGPWSARHPSQRCAPRAVVCAGRSLIGQVAIVLRLSLR